MWNGSLLAALCLLGACGPAERLEIVEDDCPDADQKVYPGVCGCSIPEERCLPLLNALVHRYAFDGSGRVARDDVGGADGQIVGTALSGAGALELDRNADVDQYVELPNGIISALGSATFEAWVLWSTPPPPEQKPFWERIFDFGVSTAGEDGREEGRSYLFLAPGRPGTVPAAGRTAYQELVEEGETRLDATEPFPVEVPFHVAVVVDEQAHEVRLFLDGREQGTTAFSGSLSKIEDVNNWLGRSQFAADTRFGGAFLEFRVYGRALTSAELDDSRAFGPSPFHLSPR